MNNNNFDEIIKEIKNAKTTADAKNHLMEMLTPEQSQKLYNICNDRELTEKILQSPEAQEIMRKFTEGNNG